MCKKPKYILLLILFIFIIFFLLTYLFGFLGFGTKRSFHISEQNGSNIFSEIGINPGECIYPSESVSPCELRCAPSEEELKMARIAWKYIENNFNKKTGLTAAAHKYPSAATWDWANAVYAIYAARKFRIITQEKYEKMMGTFLKTMQKMEIFNNELPNKTYNTNSAKMTDYVNKVQKEGTGWSAADLARLLSSLNIVEQCEENLAPQIEKLLLRYRYCRALSVEGDLYGGSMENGKLHIRHEALTGYEEYLARGYELWHHNAHEARSYKFVKEVDVYGVKIPTDTRPFFSNFIESEPFWYLGFEYGVDDKESGRYIHNMYEVQRQRYKHTGQLTAVTEDNIDTRPYFLFNTVYTGGEAWKTINQKGEDYDEYKTVSSKAAIGMRYLFDTPYANKVYNYVKNNYDPKKGYYAGIYEKRPGQNKAMTLNTNAIILESMLSSKMGPLQNLHKLENRGIYDHYRNHVNNFRCLPTDNNMTILEPYHPGMSREDNRSNDIENAKIAWQYFEKNYNEKTGFVNSKHKYGIVKPMDIGHTIMATLSAYDLKVISEATFHTRIKRLLKTLSKIKLYHNELPNLYYDAKTGKMVTKTFKQSPTGNGWNLYSIAHLATGLYYLERDFPIYRESIYKFMAKWDFKRAILKKSMQNRYFNGKDKGGFTPIKDPSKEYYIHNALNLFNIRSYSALLDERNLDYKAIYNYEVPMGYKNKVANAESYLWSMLQHPYYLKYKHYSSNIYLALKDRYLKTGKFATSSEEPLDSKPYWIRNTLYNHGKLWSDLDLSGKSHAKKRIVSIKASFIYDALYGYTDSYSTDLLQYVSSKSKSTQSGWYSGLYTHSSLPNRALHINTNAAVLESLYYKKHGNYYYSKSPLLYSKISLHHYKADNIYYLKSAPINMRHDAQTFMEHLPSQETIIRVEKENNMFVVKYGLFKQEHEAKKFMIEHNISCYEFNITKGTIDSSNFLLANQYYKYDYHIPYKNREFINENSTFKVFMKQHLLKKNFGINESKSKNKHKKTQTKKQPNKQKNKQKIK